MEVVAPQRLDRGGRIIDDEDSVAFGGEKVLQVLADVVIIVDDENVQGHACYPMEEYESRGERI